MRGLELGREGIFVSKLNFSLQNSWNLKSHLGRGDFQFHKWRELQFCEVPIPSNQIVMKF